MDVFQLILCFKSMNNANLIILLFTAATFVLCGCSKSPQSYTFQASIESQKINNLFDLDGDKKSDLFFWNTSSMSKPNKFLEPCFFETFNLSSAKYKKFDFGEISDIPIVGYFDDDSILDYGVYRYNETSSEWIIENGANKSRFNISLPESSNYPVPSDFNGDGKSDFVVYNSKAGAFRGLLSTNDVRFQQQIGSKGDIPVPKDYDGDNRADFATYNIENGEWTIQYSRTNLIGKENLGGKSFLPIPADYDGDGRADLCVWNYENNLVKPMLTTLRRPISNDIIEKIQDKIKNKDFFPIPADYDGDGISEIAFWSDSLKLLISFDIHENLKTKTYHFRSKTNSLPVSTFFLKRYYLQFIKPHTLASKPNEFIGDFDGDYIDDACLYSDETGTFFCNSTRVGWKFALQIGQKSDIPVVGNFNFDSITDIGVYRPKNKSFYIRYLGKKAPIGTQVIELSKNLPNNCVPKINDYDKDGIDDLAVFNPNEKNIVVRKSSNSQEEKIALSQ